MTLEFHVVAAEMWGDDRFDGLSDDAKLLWIRLLTGPEVSELPGLIVAGRAALAEALRWSLRKFDRAFAQFAATDAKHPEPMAVADWRSRVIWLPNACRHRRRPRNPNQVMSWRESVKIVPDCDLKRRGLGRLSEFLNTLGAEYATALGLSSDYFRAPNSANSHGSHTRTTNAESVEQEGEQPTTIPAYAGAGARSPSLSSSPLTGRGAGEGPPESPRPTSATPTDPTSAPEAEPANAPDWFRGVVETVAMQTGEQIDPAEAWLRYSGHRASKGKPVNRDDAKYWVTSVIVREARQDRHRGAPRRSSGGSPATREAFVPAPPVEELRPPEVGGDRISPEALAELKQGRWSKLLPKASPDATSAPHDPSSSSTSRTGS